MAEGSPVIEVRDVYKYYGTRRALGPLSFTIRHGEVVGLLGLNGAGKTTALRILACDLVPSSGSVLVDGIDVVDDPQRVRARLGYLPDRPPLYAEMAVDEYLAFAARLRGTPADGVERAVKSALESTQLTQVARDAIGSLSHGFRQRVGIAQAIVHSPRLVLLDEPISGLDPVQIVEIRELLLALKEKHTILLSSHILSEISQTCDRLLVLRAGVVVESGTESELSARLLEGTRFDVTVRADAARMKAALEGFAGLRNVDERAALEGGADVTSWTVTAERDVRSELVRHLVLRDVPIVGLARSDRELEDIFSRLVSGPTVV
jgi:ABC-2 type transport system ATP-binding protein